MTHSESLTAVCLLQLAEAVLQESVAAQRYATAVLLQSLHASQLHQQARGRKGPFKSANQPQHVQQLAVPASETRSEMQLQQVVSSTQEQEERIAVLEQQLMQNFSPYERGIPAVEDSPEGKQPQLSGHQLARLVRHAAAQKQQHDLVGHSCQLQAAWPLQTAPTSQQQAFAAPNVARCVMQMQRRPLAPSLQPVQPIALPLHWCSIAPARASKTENAYWQNVLISPIQRSGNGTQQSSSDLQLQPAAGAVTAMAVSPCTTNLAVGTDLGNVTVYKYNGSRIAARLDSKAANASPSGTKIFGEPCDTISVVHVRAYRCKIQASLKIHNAVHCICCWGCRSGVGQLKCSPCQPVCSGSMCMACWPRRQQSSSAVFSPTRSRRQLTASCVL